MKQCRGIENDGGEAILNKIIKESLFKNLTFEKRTEWGEGVFENSWGKNVSGRKRFRIPHMGLKFVLRNSKKASWVITGRSGKRWSQRERQGQIMPICQITQSLRIFQSDDIIPNMLSTRSGISPWILLVFCTIEQCLWPLQESQWCSVMRLCSIIFFSTWFGEVGELTQWMKVKVSAQFCATSILMRPVVKLVSFPK